MGDTVMGDGAGGVDGAGSTVASETISNEDRELHHLVELLAGTQAKQYWSVIVEHPHLSLELKNRMVRILLIGQAEEEKETMG